MPSGPRLATTWCHRPSATPVGLVIVRRVPAFTEKATRPPSVRYTARSGFDPVPDDAVFHSSTAPPVADVVRTQASAENTDGAVAATVSPARAFEVPSKVEARSVPPSAPTAPRVTPDPSDRSRPPAQS
ncbi:hypothetical protein GCM10025868_14790 [Angustibacter aerolatus]|uniref:Uncharacterized protein n=1 Tax=Angustibacter aerolatus TaxID=1162965 RepID=A0ABQ6JFP9_9ACTN|nr:hypothetical protein GCM10025868_14790 [Angustibacter aerolatus]